MELIPKIRCNYLNIDDYFEDTFQEDSIYANKRNIERYFNGAAALLPVVDKIWEYFFMN